MEVDCVEMINYNVVKNNYYKNNYYKNNKVKKLNTQHKVCIPKNFIFSRIYAASVKCLQ